MGGCGPSTWGARNMKGYADAHPDQFNYLYVDCSEAGSDALGEYPGVGVFDENGEKVDFWVGKSATEEFMKANDDTSAGSSDPLPDGNYCFHESEGFDSFAGSLGMMFGM